MADKWDHQNRGEELAQGICDSLGATAAAQSRRYVAMSSGDEQAIEDWNRLDRMRRAGLQTDQPVDPNRDEVVGNTNLQNYWRSRGAQTIPGAPGTPATPIPPPNMQNPTVDPYTGRWRSGPAPGAPMGEGPASIYPNPPAQPEGPINYYDWQWGY
jgi:hypothetical protein